MILNNFIFLFLCVILYDVVLIKCGNKFWCNDVCVLFIGINKLIVWCCCIVNVVVFFLEINEYVIVWFNLVFFNIFLIILVLYWWLVSWLLVIFLKIGNVDGILL